jgi:hypothetical protein
MRATSIVGMIAMLVIAGLLVALAVAIVRFQRRRKQIADAAGRLSVEQLEHLYALITKIGSAASTGGVLAYSPVPASHRDYVVSIPEDLPGFPWAGWSFAVEAAKEVSFRRLHDAAAFTGLGGRRYRYVAVPRQATKSGKHRNVFDPARYLEQSPALRDAVVAACPEYPAQLLSFLLCDRNIEFEPINQPRIGTSPAWVQDPEFQSCDTCGKRMALVIQLPGTLVHPKAFHRGTFFLFGCKAHPEQLKTLGQFT